MQNQNDIEKINQFLNFVSPIIIRQIKALLETAGLEVKEQGYGLNLTFVIKSGNKSIEFYMHNLFLEIATIDRDEVPLRFDERLRDPEYFLGKAAHLTQSKLAILLQLLTTDNVEAAMENLTKDASQYERLRIWRFDTKPP